MEDRPNELEEAIRNIVQIMKQIPQLAENWLGVVGSLALWHYLPSRPPGDEIEFVTNVAHISSLKEMLLDHPSSPFRVERQAFLYRSPAGRDIPVKISSRWWCPQLPEPEHLVRGIPYGGVPYVSLPELASFMLKLSKSKTLSQEQRRRNSIDAAELINYELRRDSPDHDGAPIKDETFRARKRRYLQSMALRLPPAEDSAVVQGDEVEEDAEFSLSPVMQTLPPLEA
ncbi:hypothetical protein F5B22DRAFT_649073 [Xylaria bambusicola]|uniref:uncharacterized protein n=1 Tax=Xylaria bambusicola TaxID=326684 RepID=UPI0020076653|nr:uncharacterized protein F5B22DRAFT_649073 [Xylaria bambusicola]KAI0509444.1 hypothetical protein F5B22DRAFT_649073 [Xylaria bambusicola]